VEISIYLRNWCSAISR